MKKLTYGDADDWAGIWIDGKIEMQGHSITKWEWLKLLAQGPFDVDDQGDAPWCYEMTNRLGCFEDLS